MGEITSLQMLREVMSDKHRDPGVRYLARQSVERIDPSSREPRTILVWAIGLAMIVGGIALSAESRAAGVTLFAAGCGLLAVYWWWHARRGRGDSSDDGVMLGWGDGGGGGNGSG